MSIDPFMRGNDTRMLIFGLIMTVIVVVIVIVVVLPDLPRLLKTAPLVDQPISLNSNSRELVKEKLNDLPEVKVFQNRYGEPKVTVEGRQVLYEKTEAQITGVQYNGTQRLEPQVVLIIDIDYDANVERMEFTCVNDTGGGTTLTDKNILQYLEKESCF